MSKDMDRRRFLGVLGGGTVAAALVGEGVAHAAAQASTSITINGASSGNLFYGIGAISGGGGTSRLLFDYPARQQSEILDYLFKPNYGASLHIFKVEIGGDTNSTNGAEASHMRSRTDQNYNRGYEWWLMEQAKARNPNIKLYGLEWGAPGWFQASPDIDARHPFWSHDNITYIINWIQHAQSDHGLHIDYIGGWNESGYNKIWYEDLKKALVSNGLSTKIVASDDAGWAVATDMKNDAAFNSAIDIVGSHYPATRPPTADAISLKKPLWASENATYQTDVGYKFVVQTLNDDYISEGLTGDIRWNMAAAWYPTLPFAGAGLLLAEEPWSGNYFIGRDIWAMAHTAQFTQPGWQYLKSASGYLGASSSNSNGSYVTLKASNGKDYSVIIETMAAKAAQTASFTVTGGLSTGTIHVWATNFNSTNDSEHFIRQKDITPVNGAFSLTLQPGYAYSLTTTTGQGKGATTPPASKGLALPYSENFDTYASGTLARYFSDVNGAFETYAAGGGRTGMALRQVITTAPIAWHSGSPTAPLTVMGDINWANYQVSADVLLEHAGYLELIGNLVSQVRLSGAAEGYHLRVTSTGAWTLFKEGSTSSNTIQDTTLASGTVPFSLNNWHTLSLILKNGTIQALIDKKSVASLRDSTYTHGQIGLLVSKWINARFDNISIV